jgi:hypothetical protein
MVYTHSCMLSVGLFIFLEFENPITLLTSPGSKSGMHNEMVVVQGQEGIVTHVTHSCFIDKSGPNKSIHYQTKVLNEMCQHE